MPTANRLISAHTQSRAARERTLRRAAQAILLSEDNWYDPYRVRDMSYHLGELVDGAVAQEGRLTQAYLQGLYQEGGITATPPGANLTRSQRLGLTHTGEAYNRIPGFYRSHISRGSSHEEALEISMDRMRTMLATDLQLAHQEMTRRVMLANRGNTTGYRRIIRPELSRGNTCGLCIAAADRMYYISDLMPLHSGCKCDTAPVTRDFDPGISLNREDLDALYHAAGGDATGAEDLRRVRVNIYNHGETGPTLKPEGQGHTTPRAAYTQAKPGNRPAIERPDIDAAISQADSWLQRAEREADSHPNDHSMMSAVDWHKRNLSTLITRKNTGKG